MSLTRVRRTGANTGRRDAAHKNRRDRALTRGIRHYDWRTLWSAAHAAAPTGPRHPSVSVENAAADPEELCPF